MTGLAALILAASFAASPAGAQDPATAVSPVEVRPMTHQEAQKKRLERWSDEIVTCKTVPVGTSGITQKVCATNRDWSYDQLAITTSLKGLKPVAGSGKKK